MAEKMTEAEHTIISAMLSRVIDRKERIRRDRPDLYAAFDALAARGLITPRTGYEVTEAGMAAYREIEDETEEAGRRALAQEKRS